MVIAFPKWLADEMRTRNLSMRELGRRAGISHAWISNVVGGQTEPTWDFVGPIAVALEVSLDEALRRAGLLPPLPAPTVTYIRLIEAINSLTPEQQAFLLQVARNLIPRSAPPEDLELLQRLKEEEPEVWHRLRNADGGQALPSPDDDSS